MDDIRLRIILGVGGFESISKPPSAIRNVGPAAAAMATQVNKSGDAAQRSQGLFSKLSDTLARTEQMYDRVYRAGFQLQLAGDMLYNTGKRGLEVLSGSVEKYKDYDFILRKAGTALNTDMIP